GRDPQGDGRARAPTQTARPRPAARGLLRRCHDFRSRRFSRPCDLSRSAPVSERDAHLRHRQWYAGGGECGAHGRAARQGAAAGSRRQGGLNAQQRGQLRLEVGKMDTKQIEIESLYAGLNRTCLRAGIALASSWLFAAFSFYLSRKFGDDWFSRSGSMMALIGTAATFRLVGGLQYHLAIAIKKKLAFLEREIELALEPPRSFRMVSYFSYLTGI